MKVLHVIPSVSGVYGGPSRAIVDIEHALAQRAIDVTVAFTKDADEHVELFGEPMSEMRPPQQNRFGFLKNTRFYKISFDLSHWLKLNVQRFDLVHIHGLFSFPSVAAALVARGKGVPYIVRPVGVLQQYGMKQRRPIFKKISFALIERPLLEDSAAVHFTSAAEMSDAEKLGLHCNSVVIPLGIDVRATALRCGEYDSREVTILYLSRLDPKKNVEGLLQAFALVSNGRPNLVLKIAGDGTPQYVRKLKALAEAFDISDRVEWLGHIAGDRKAKMFLTASIFVLPSYSENFGIAAVEALAAGLPCIISDGVAIAPDIEKAGAGIVTSTDPRDLAAGICRLLGDKKRCLAMSAAARRLAEESFSIEIMGSRLEALYHTICEAHRRKAVGA
jgi:glycosyltransferase involved in cell wall biosynthesis